MKLTSAALPSSEAFRANRAAHLALLDTARAAALAAAAGSGAKAMERHVSRGKMPPRERGGEPARSRLALSRDRGHGGAWHV